jgi:hypothetical protein
MKLTAPYQCDYCAALKGEANHWWLCWIGLDSNDHEVFSLQTWDEKKASALYEHICSEACAVKALSKWMARPR